MSSAVLSSKISTPPAKKYFVHQASIGRVHWLSYNLSKGWLDGRGKAKDAGKPAILINHLSHPWKVGRGFGNMRGTWGEAERVQKVWIIFGQWGLAGERLRGGGSWKLTRFWIYNCFKLVPIGTIEYKLNLNLIKFNGRSYFHYTTYF